MKLTPNYIQFVLCFEKENDPFYFFAETLDLAIEYVETNYDESFGKMTLFSLTHEVEWE